MARSFTLALSQYLEIDQSPVNGMPLTIAAWFCSTNSLSQALVWAGDKDVSDQYYCLWFEGIGYEDQVVAEIRAGSSYFARSTTYTSSGVWQHACAVFTSSTHRAAFLNGGGKGEDTSSCNPSGLDRVSIARFGDNSPGIYADSLIAEVAIWDAALTDAEVALLALGASPLMVRPKSLASYWPLIRDTDQDWVGGYDLTPYNSPTVADHPPRVFHPLVWAVGSPPSAGPITEDVDLTLTQSLAASLVGGAQAVTIEAERRFLSVPAESKELDVN